MKIKIFLALFLILIFVTPVDADSTVPPFRTIPVTGSSMVNVTSNIINILSMKNGNEVSIPSMNIKNMKANVVIETVKTLPVALPNDVAKFVDALSISIVVNSSAIDRLPKNKSLTVSFAKNSILTDTPYSVAILYWTGTEWIELETNSLQTTTNLSGLYVLILK
jgi:hypothetical protein